jgi:two-component system chemotaxis sensor kinase CheA
MNNDRYIAAFNEEAVDLLTEIEQAALKLESGEQTNETVNKLFRAFHTIKGSAGMCGLRDIVEFTNHVENVLDQVREGKLPVTPKLIDLVLRAKDQIAGFLGVEQDDEAPVSPRSRETLVAELLTQLSQAVGYVAPPVSSSPKKEKQVEEEAFLF